ncbi:MAG: hypothetical protein OXN17_11905 [Candidatus Poribacteria bacterium]|nr:hypothetical protein [Candidatus Poribacteria bacterium]MDE0504794.1 hypothetical protein [Candidatus Poribacteria bacterium]
MEAIAYSPDGTRLVIGGSIGIWIYDAHTGAEIGLLTGHTRSVNSVASVPMDTLWQAGDWTNPFGCGSWRQGSW